MAVDAVERGADGAAEQFEHHGYGGGCGQPQAVEGVKQQDVGDHDREEHDHKIGKLEHLGVEDALAGYFHHAAREGGAGEHADAGDQHDDFERGNAGADGRTQEVHGVVADTHEKVKSSQQGQKHQHDYIEGFHGKLLSVKSARKTISFVWSGSSCLSSVTIVCRKSDKRVPFLSL